jgi:hypothetical protein
MGLAPLRRFSSHDEAYGDCCAKKGQAKREGSTWASMCGHHSPGERNEGASDPNDPFVDSGRQSAPPFPMKAGVQGGVIGERQGDSKGKGGGQFSGEAGHGQEYDQGENSGEMRLHQVPVSGNAAS